MGQALDPVPGAGAAGRAGHPHPGAAAAQRGGGLWRRVVRVVQGRSRGEPAASLLARPVSSSWVAARALQGRLVATAAARCHAPWVGSFNSRPAPASCLPADLNGMPAPSLPAQIFNEDGLNYLGESGAARLASVSWPGHGEAPTCSPCGHAWPWRRLREQARPARLCAATRLAAHLASLAGHALLSVPAQATRPSSTPSPSWPCC